MNLNFAGLSLSLSGLLVALLLAGAPARAQASDGAAPPPLACGLVRGAFALREAAETRYVAYVPERYRSETPAPLVVGLHGCGDSAAHFADWAVAPPETRAQQEHVAISIDGASGRRGCWDLVRDRARVLQAVDDVARCLAIEPRRVVVAGYSSGGMLAYALVTTPSSRFAAALIECAAFRGRGVAGRVEPAGRAEPKPPIYARAHREDRIFPLAQVRRDVARLARAGFPLELEVTAGDHHGTTLDWIEFLLPRGLAARAP